MSNLSPLQSARILAAGANHSRRAVILVVLLLLGILLWQLQQDFAHRLLASEQSSLEHGARLAHSLEKNLELRAYAARTLLADATAHTDEQLSQQLKALFPSLLGLQRLATADAQAAPTESAAGYHYSLVEGNEIHLRLHAVGPSASAWRLRFGPQLLQRVLPRNSLQQLPWVLEDNRSGLVLLSEPARRASAGLTLLSAEDRALSVGRTPLQHTDWVLHAQFDRFKTGQRLFPKIAGTLAIFLVCSLAALFLLLLLSRRLREVELLNRQVLRALVNAGSILHTIEERVLVTSTNGQIRYLNPQAAALLGNEDTAALEGLSLQDLLPDLDPFLLHGDAGDPHHQGLVSVTENGELRQFSVARRLLKDREQPGYAWVLRDVTDEQQTLQRLQEARRRYQEISKAAALRSVCWTFSACRPFSQRNRSATKPDCASGCARTRNGIRHCSPRCACARPIRSPCACSSSGIWRWRSSGSYATRRCTKTACASIWSSRY